MKTFINVLFCLTLFLSSSAYPEAIRDGSTGLACPAGGCQPLSGNFTISQDLGTPAGSNLFHSFDKFNINTGESATFTSTDSFKNVISRVTGGSSSWIDGKLISTIPNANFYFINPAGVVFGSSASVNVPAAFYVSTANSLQFAADGSSFYADKNAASTFSVADPTSFGFLNNQGGDIKLQDSWLQFNKANTVSLSAHNVTIDNSWLENPSGNIQIHATGNTAIDLSINNPVTAALTGRIELKGSIYGSWLDVSGITGISNLSSGTTYNSGNVTLQGGDIFVDNSLISANNWGSSNIGLLSTKISPP
jgi:filamentous hemagglutinin family protein